MTADGPGERLGVSPTQLIDRSRRVAFDFDGRAVEGYEGDTIASALYASGVRIFSRSFKYHRPRGLLCVAGNCANCLMTVDGVPNVRVCTEPVRSGLSVAGTERLALGRARRAFGTGQARSADARRLLLQDLPQSKAPVDDGAAAHPPRRRAGQARHRQPARGAVYAPHRPRRRCGRGRRPVRPLRRPRRGRSGRGA